MTLQKIINLLNKADDFIKNDKFANKEWKGVISEKNKKHKPALLTRICPAGLAGQVWTCPKSEF